MPVYEYRCPDCTHVFEKLVPMSSADQDVSCPTCGARTSRLISTFAAIGSTREGGMPAPSTGGGGGCCGGGCGRGS